jgi:hypothetical protein
MFKNIKNKLLTWKGILSWPIVKIVGAILAIHVVDWLLELFAPIWREKWGIKMIMSLFSWQIWTIISLVGLLMLTLESACRLISKKGSDFNEQLSQKEKEFKTKEDELKKQLNISQNEIAQLKKQLEDSNVYISLTEAVSKLIEDSNQKDTMAYHNAINIDINGLYDKLAKLIAERRVDIYGNNPSSQGHEKIKIPKDAIEGSVFKRMASELWSASTLYANYNSGGPTFIDLAIKKDDLDRVIQEILSEGTSLFVGY